jgi:hypothetical protein
MFNINEAVTALLIIRISKLHDGRQGNTESIPQIYHLTGYKIFVFGAVFSADGRQILTALPTKLQKSTLVQRDYRLAK